MEFITGVLVGIAAWPAFWLIFAIMTVILSAFIVNERGGWSAFFTIGLVLMGASKWQAILANPLPLILGVLGYLVIGILWSRFKWSRFLSEKFNRLASVRDRYLKHTGLTKEQLKDLNADQLEEYKLFIRNHYGRDYDDQARTVDALRTSLAPKAVTNKGSIVMWIAYWPVTVVWYMIADIVVDIGKGLYKLVGGHFQKMSTEKFSQL